MSDDFNKRLQQISELLGKEGMSQNLSSLLSMLVSNSNTGEQPQPEAKEENVENTREDKDVNDQKSERDTDTREQKSEKDKPDDNIEMLRKVKSIMDAMDNTKDPRINLLAAIRPFLSSSRQKKVSDCIRLFQMTQLTRLINENDKEKIFKEG